MSKRKLVVIVILAVLTAILVFQNTQPVETRVFFATVTMPCAVLLLVTVVIGFALGVLVSLGGVKWKADKPA